MPVAPLVLMPVPWSALEDPPEYRVPPDTGHKDPMPPQAVLEDPVLPKAIPRGVVPPEATLAVLYVSLLLKPYNLS